MCKQCIEALAEVFPEIPKEEWSDFLTDCTCYPFGHPDDIKKQLVDLRKKMTTDDYRECYAIADQEMNAAIKKQADA